MPPIRCIPCRVTYEGQRYQIESNGDVRPLHKGFDNTGKRIFIADALKQDESFARLVRREASRQRRNRNARDRYQAHVESGMKRTPYGWE